MSQSMHTLAPAVEDTPRTAGRPVEVLAPELDGLAGAMADSVRPGPSAAGGRIKTVLAISSGGGHWVQLLRLRPAMVGCRVTFVTVNGAYRADVPGERFRTIPDAT